MINEYVYKDYSIPETENQKILQHKLLSIGGEKVIHLPDPEIETLLKQGKLINHSKIVKKRGQPSQCHGNSALLWLKHPTKVRICTGWALHDGIWRQHTWGLEGKRKIKILETTVPSDCYFGRELSPTLASYQFACANLPMDVAGPYINDPYIFSFMKPYLIERGAL